MLRDLESYESEFQIAEKIFFTKENELNDKLQISELEKQNLNNKLDYYQQMYSGLNTNYNVSVNNILQGNKNINDEICALNNKLDLFYNHYVKMESLLLNKRSQKIVLKNLDSFALKFKLNEISESIKNIISTKNDVKKADLVVEKNNGENKSEMYILKKII